ncbi:MAG: Integrase catalytic region [Ramlibacter sp.]|nr:Integrase catalytic region [Ramlibacter sp.]
MPRRNASRADSRIVSRRGRGMAAHRVEPASGQSAHLPGSPLTQRTVSCCCASESPRLLRRLNTLRGLSHEQVEQVLTRGREREVTATQILKDFIDKHRDTFGVEPICKVLQIAPSVYRRHAALLREPHRRCARAQRDEALAPEIQRVWLGNMQVYGADKITRQLAREGTVVARCTVGLMRRLGVRGVMRGTVVRTQRQQGALPAGPGQPAVPGRAAESTVGQRGPLAGQFAWRGQGATKPPHAPQHPRAGPMAESCGEGVLRIARCADQRPGARRIPAPRYRPLATNAAASQSEGPHELEPNDEAR